MLKIGAIFEGKLTDGGGFQTQISTLRQLHEAHFANFVFFVFSKQNQQVLQNNGFKSILVPNGILNKTLKVLHRSSLLYDIFFKLGILTSLEKKLTEQKIDLCYFLSPSFESYYLKRHNYIFTMWDTSHREFMEFPEVNFNGNFERREKLYSSVLKKATGILVDSDHAKQNLQRYYAINQERIYPCSFLPSVNAYERKEIDIKKKYSINGEYIYYPAQFWAHKNHAYIIDTLKVLKNQNIKITAVFSGSDQGNLENILNYATQEGVRDQILYIGFAPNEEIYSLFSNALALVMPTYFGATNIPPLEAFQIGTPVIYSRLPDLMAQTQEAALYCDLNDPHSLSCHIQDLLENQNLRQDLISKGKQRLKELTKIKATDLLQKILIEYKQKCKNFNNCKDKK